MKDTASKTARFQALVARAGPPETYTPWSDPKRDHRFQKAWRQHRLLSVRHSISGNRKDFGEVGYVAGANDLLPAPTSTPGHERLRPLRKHPRPEKQPPKPKRFEVTVRVTAAVPVIQTVEADSPRVAAAAVIKDFDARSLDFTHAIITRRVVKTRPRRD